MSEPPRRLPPKKEVALALLEGPSVFVHLDPRRPGVVVPKWFLGQPQLVLQVGLNMAIPIPDLKVDEDGVTCTLSFSRTPFWCHLPWTAVYALVGEDGRGMIWPNDVPPEVSLQMQKAATPAAKPAAKKGRARLSVKGRGRSEGADGVAERASADSNADAAPAPAPRGRPVPMAIESRIEERPAVGEPEGSPAPSSARTDGGGKKPRRELPPYLRVIK